MAAPPQPVTELKVLTVNLGLLRLRVLGVKEVRPTAIVAHCSLHPHPAFVC